MLLKKFMKRNMLTCIPPPRYLLLNFITSKLYTSSLLSSLNSRRGWGYDASETNLNDEEFLNDLGLRFVSNSQSVDRTSFVITAPVSSSILFPIMMGYTYHQDFVPGERTTRLTISARSERKFRRWPGGLRNAYIWPSLSGRCD